ncbi:fructose-bisphosphate aldolase class I [soil metagenome]
MRPYVKYTGENVTSDLQSVARQLVSDGKGLIAMDESPGTCNKRFADIGIAETEENRRLYRQIIVDSHELEQYVNGAILCDETAHQSLTSGMSFVQFLTDKGIIPGIKVDGGTVTMPLKASEKITEGLDGLRERLTKYYELGFRFAKWRAVFVTGTNTPSQANIEANCQTLALYAAYCQESGLVPIVEPEVLMDGAHDIQACAQATQEVLQKLFTKISNQGVDMEAMLLKPNMVLAGLENAMQPEIDEVVARTIECLKRSVPAAVPGIVFLSGGQPSVLATERLNAMHVQNHTLPWALSFSFSRAILQPALEIWKGNSENIEAAQKALLKRAYCNKAAARGQYIPIMEA